MGKDHFSMTQSSKNHDTADRKSIFFQAFALQIQYLVLNLLADFHFFFFPIGEFIPKIKCWKCMCMLDNSHLCHA